MSTTTIIVVENLGKKYVIGHQSRQRYVALRDTISSAARNVWRKTRDFASGRPVIDGDALEEVWALADVNFQIGHGEAIGIIGRNGAGKSTLLKILGRITEPTTGEVRIKGRLASLLEVGTGFHPELTGRENIFLNGAILGMSRADVRRRFDEIVDFAEIETFLDTPVKRYSSGMQVRLAFAVAAHLESEILLVDEVLAVGDVDFQRKCFGKIHDAAISGRTVLFVSHNMAAVATLTKRVVHLDRGRLVCDAPTAEGIQSYLQHGSPAEGMYRATLNDQPHQIVSVEMPSLVGQTHVSGDTLRIRVIVRSREKLPNGCLSVQVTNENLHGVLHLRAYDHGVFFGDHVGEIVLECAVPNCRLNVGRYVLNLFLAGPPGGDFFESVQAVCPFDVAVHAQFALFGWRPEVCTYIVDEAWVREPVVDGEWLTVAGRCGSA